MHLSDGIDVASAIAYLIIAISALLRSARSPMAPVLARTTACLFSFAALEVLKHVLDWPGFEQWQWGAEAVSAATMAALVLTFLGERRRLVAWTIFHRIYFVTIAFVCFVAASYEPLRRLFTDRVYAIAMLAGVAPEFSHLAYLLRRHAVRSDSRERARTQVLALATILGVTAITTDLGALGGLGTPRIASYALAGCALMLGALTFRFELLEGVRGLVFVNAVGIAAVVLVGQLLTLSLASWSVPLTATVAAALSVAALATLRPIIMAIAEERDRTRHLTTMGRFSSQMAHDLRNPLAAIRGAAQFLAEEKKRGRSIDAHGSFVDLVLEQADRMAKVVDEYQRLGRAEAVRSDANVASIVSHVADAARASWPGATITTQTAEVAMARIDGDLVAQALENLVRNAYEASAEAGARIEISARPRGRALDLTVQDHGSGMDARTRERALDEFFTTKASGSGLGLAFVARVSEAHGGRVAIESSVGEGTTITMQLADALGERDEPAT